MLGGVIRLEFFNGSVPAQVETHLAAIAEGGVAIRVQHRGQALFTGHENFVAGFVAVNLGASCAHVVLWVVNVLLRVASGLSITGEGSLGITRVDTPHLPIPWMSNAYEHIRNSPLAKWAAEKRQRTPATIAEKAKKLGLVFGHSTTTNVEQYSVSYQGKILKTGTLNIISWYIDKCAENPALYR